MDNMIDKSLMSKLMNAYCGCLLRSLWVFELDMLLHQDQRLVEVEGY